MRFYNDDFIGINETYDKMPYEKQIESKQQMISDSLARNLFDIEPKQIIRNPKPLHYRHKVIVSATNIKTKGRYQLRLGLFKEGTKTIIPGVDNHLHDNDIIQVLKTVEMILRKYKLEAYTYKYPRGIIKHVLVRKSYYNKTMLLVFVTQGFIFPNHKQIVKEVRQKHPQIETVVQNIHNIDTPVVLLDKSKVLYGPGFIVDEIDGLRFRISSNSFYQVNPIQMMKLYDETLRVADIKPNDVVMDCYSGIGTLALLAARKAKEVIAIETNKDAVRDALKNKKMNELNNVYFHSSNVEDFMFDYDKHVDVLIMDPARDGADQRFIDAMLRLQPKRIIYVSCFIETMIRDIQKLKNKYKAISMQPVDMFSYTSHVESVTLLELR
ncbi:MAG: 23S rRNA (uracil(1939)-C(5))-methyltransferase RlmD [Bacilli bacterium]|nr:23S rRNA (uracil(1939)-C(5))-methyltransferase RlmD [Bacilli bacterium]MBN2876865.1 23S rRNA (uracil(1939)-C(5))-methyltransferase RlmD [Bacilli bacterium]